MAEETKTAEIVEETANAATEAAEAIETAAAEEEVEVAENTIVKKTKTTTTVTTYGNETVTVSNGLTVKQALLIGLVVGVIAGFLLKACVF